MFLGVLATERSELVEALALEDVLELDPVDLLAQIGVDQAADRVRVLEDVRALGRRVRRVDRSRDRADVREREVEERPFEAVASEDAERVALLDPDREQPVRELLHDPVGLVPRDLPPAVLILDEVRGVLAVLGDCLVPERPDRAHLA